MTVNQILILARKHIDNGCDMASSARLCLEDAIKLYDDGDLKGAGRRAIASLKYSVGILHTDYQRAARSGL